MPKRIQRKRQRGWRMPENAVYVGRPTKWGNPFKVGPDGTSADCTRAYRKWSEKAWDGWRHMVEQDLRGKDLVCWCRLDQECHADVLLEIANAPARDAR